MNYLRKIKQILIQLISFLIKYFNPVKKGRVFCLAFEGLQYSCNPKYITEEILKSYSDQFQMVWAFNNPNKIKGLDDRIKKVKIRSFKELYYLNTSEFIIVNTRICNHWSKWEKRPNQKYIMTWHGSMALKRVEFDAEEHLPKSYIKNAETDSKKIDLMLSDSKWCTQFYKTAFHFNGEILEKGLPRNDIFLQPDAINQIADKVRSFFHISGRKKILLYAPTFRVDKSIDKYITQWDSILSALKEKFNSDFVVMIRLHPNMMGVVDATPIMTSSFCVDATEYGDMQELLCAADILMTDYSSSMFEVAIKQTPCFLYVPDRETYDRGFYFKLEELPFPFAKDLNSLCQQIKQYDTNDYSRRLESMFENLFKSVQLSKSSSEVINWMVSKTI